MVHAPGRRSAVCWGSRN